MTIGIAAAGPRAGQAVLDGLRAAEAIGRGALHGFVSFVAIGRDGVLHRAEVQDGGAAALFGGAPMPAALADAERAGLMSSGPNRPDPLSQFTPADPAVGLVTGHRFPNMPGLDGTPLNVAVLDLMRQGLSPQRAVDTVAGSDPAADAGFLALSQAGDLYAVDTAYLAAFADAGRAIGRSRDGLACAGVVHNAITPWRSLAALVVETTLAAMDTLNDRVNALLDFAAGVPLEAGARNALTIDASGRVLSVIVRDARHLTGQRSFGLGYRAAVLKQALAVGYAQYEPYLRAVDGRIESINGLQQFDLPVTFAARPD